MRFALASLRSNNAPPMSHGRREVVHEGGQQGVTFNAGVVKLHHSPISDNTATGAGKVKWASVAWAWATVSIVWAVAVSSIVWAVFVYLMERERRRAQVELARLEMEGRKQIPSN